MAPFWHRKKKSKSGSQEDASSNRGSPPPLYQSPSPSSSSSNGQPSANPYAQVRDPYAQAPSRDRPSDPYATRGSPHRPSPGPRGLSVESADGKREDLFGNRPARSSSPYASRHPRDDDWQAGQDDRDAQDPQMTEEEMEEQIQGVKREIKMVQQKSHASTQNSIRIALDTEEQARSSLETVGRQGEKLSNVRKLMDTSSVLADDSTAATTELELLHNTHFFVPVASKLAKGEKKAKKIEERYDREIKVGEERRKAAYESAQRINTALDKPGSARALKKKGKQYERATREQRNKHLFEADSEDEQMEKDIDANLTQLGEITGRLKSLAMATSEELEHQNKMIDPILETVFPTFHSH
jgi:protein transport protein SEC9